MESKADHVVQNIGAIAEAASLFYNTAAKQVPKDVALALTRHFMDLTIARRTLTPAQLAAIAEARRRELEQRGRQQPEQQEQPPAEPEK